jgi:hypothetical protein
MDPVTIGAALAAIAGGAGGALGAQVWAAVSALVRRPFRRAQSTGENTAALPTGEAELAALEQVPADQGRAVALAEMLVARAKADTGFREALEAWWVQASQINFGWNVTNTISGGTFHSPVQQGRDFNGLTFGSPAPQESTPRSSQEPGA